MMPGSSVSAKQNEDFKKSACFLLGWLGMSDGLLSRAEDIRIHLGPNKEIVSASDPVFQPENQEEARTMIYEADYLLDYLEEFSAVLGLGEATFVAVAEQERQTCYSYKGNDGSLIVLTKAHRGMKQLLKDMEEGVQVS